jgi:hypothetical protein
MNDVDRWVHLEGPRPQIVGELLSAAYDAGPEAPEDAERLDRAILARIDASAADGSEEEEADDGGSAPKPPLQAAHDGGAEPWGDEGSGAPVPKGASRPPEGVAGTAMALDLPPEVWHLRGKLPFVPPEQVPPAKRAARTLEVPVMRSALGETLPLDDHRLAKVIATLPFAASTAGEGVASIPDLSLSQYASLCAELTVRPAAASQIRKLYGLSSDAELRLLHEHWWTRLATHPDERAAFAQKLPVFTEFVRSRPG